jgi:hypothetical protein
MVLGAAPGHQVMDDLDLSWKQKGGTLSDKNARKEFGLSQQEIMEAMQRGVLHYKVGSAYGNPFFLLVRTEVEALVKEKLGETYPKDQRTKKELAAIDRELRRLKTRMTALEKQRANLLSSGRA